MCKERFCARLNTRRGMPLILAMCWICGLFLGTIPYFFFSKELFPLMHRTASCSVSIVGLLNAALIPFLLSAVFIVFSMPLAIAGVCFVEAFLFSFVSLGILLSFASYGWLLRYFLQFSGCTMLPLLYWYWLHSVSTPVRLHWLVFSCAVCVVIVIATALDYRIIAPFVCLIDSTKG